MAAVAIAVRGHRLLTPMPYFLNSPAWPRVHVCMPYLATMTMLAPSRAARLAIAKPMPREEPVMNRVLP